VGSIGGSRERGNEALRSITRSSGKNYSPTFPACHLFEVLEPHLMELNLSELTFT
jgi:hypothetical protein